MRVLLCAITLGLALIASPSLRAQELDPAAGQTNPAPIVAAPSIDGSQATEPAAPIAQSPLAESPASPAQAMPSSSDQTGTDADATPAAPAATETVPTTSFPVATEDAASPNSAESALSLSLPHDLSPWGMFMAADIVVKAVMIGLAFASLVTWTVWIAKTLELAGARARATKALRVIVHARTLNEAVEQLNDVKGPAASFVRSARREVSISGDVPNHAGSEGLKERVESSLARIEARAGRNMARGTGVLATIGSTSPFVGLFGTVWGIMNSFIGISQSQTTNLAIVAPGIAEALLATALGLVAAIPAVVIYNLFARSIAGYRHLLADAASGVERLVSRDLDFNRVPKLRAAE